ncbi:unnamed protein product [Acanthoscelides obtectus]|uniref:THAP-type domain-containing protein n=1 Tax=Acanthoscelides obtectus TaxID=200917 RepID=A0A9P0PK54_ACAOB|nr:unnamed protein product [Acanthoscelides obtectus]CAK1651124.1 THAP domain-containing protein 2 [Acanthoscelides obtectus]
MEQAEREFIAARMRNEKDSASQGKTLAKHRGPLCAVNCCSRRRKDVKMKFHRIPRDPNMRKLRLHAIRRENFTPSTTTVICEKHFTPEDYEVSVHGNKVLKKVAVPSVFDFPAYLKKEPSHRRVLKRKHEESYPKATEQTLAIGEVVEEPENGDHADDGNILAAGTSNIT